MDNITRLYIPKEEISSNLTIVLNEVEDIHYLKNVKRLKESDFISIFNESYGEWLAKIIKIKHKYIEILPINITNKDDKKSDFFKIISFSPIKKENLTYFLSKGIEMGVDFIAITNMDRTIVKIKDEKKIPLIIKNSLQQSQRLSAPIVQSFESIKLLIDCFFATKNILKFSKNNFKTRDSIIIIIFDLPKYNSEQNKFSNIMEKINKIKGESNIAILGLIGPEGGFSDLERKYLNLLRKEFKVNSQCVDNNLNQIDFDLFVVSLSQYSTLRSETAFISAISYINILTESLNL